MITDKAIFEFCIALSAAFYNGEIQKILSSNRRDKLTSDARRLACYLFSVSYGASIRRTALFAKRDRSTIRYSLSKLEQKRDDPDFDFKL